MSSTRSPGLCRGGRFRQSGRDPGEGVAVAKDGASRGAARASRAVPAEAALPRGRAEGRRRGVPGSGGSARTAPGREADGRQAERDAALSAHVATRGAIRNGLEADGGLRQRAEARVNAILVESETPTAAGLLVAVGLKEGRRARVWCQAVEGEVTPALIRTIEAELAQVPAPELNAGRRGSRSSSSWAAGSRRNSPSSPTAGATRRRRAGRRRSSRRMTCSG